MENYILYRPYKSIKKSIGILSDVDVQLVKIRSSLYIKKLYGEHINIILNKCKDFKFYQNKHNPYYKDLLSYYTLSSNRWRRCGGDIIDYLTSDQLEWIKSKSQKRRLAKISMSMCVKHRRHMLEYDHYYSEFF